MSTSSQTSGPHEYFDFSTNIMRYDFTLSGCTYDSDTARVRAYKDEWTYSTLVPNDQTFEGTGSRKAWWNIPSTGDFNLELTANASSRTVSTKGTWYNG